MLVRYFLLIQIKAIKYIAIGFYTYRTGDPVHHITNGVRILVNILSIEREVVHCLWLLINNV